MLVCYCSPFRAFGLHPCHTRTASWHHEVLLWVQCQDATVGSRYTAWRLELTSDVPLTIEADSETSKSHLLILREVYHYNPRELKLGTTSEVVCSYDAYYHETKPHSSGMA